MARGDIHTVAEKGGYSAKPRPAVVIQADEFSGSGSVTFCLITSSEADAGDVRVSIEPSNINGLARRSWVMVDKIMTLRRDRIGRYIGRLSGPEMRRVEDAIILFLDLAR